MKRSENRILTTHTGSIIRPRELLDLAAAAKESAEQRDRYHAFLEGAVADVVRKQAALGLDIINDGEYGKSSWSNYILSRITGFEVRPEQKRPVRWLGRARDRFADALALD